MFKTLLIARYLCAPEYTNPTLCSADDDDDGGGGGGGADDKPPPAKPKTFTQEDVARIAAKEKREAAAAARAAADAEWKEKHEAQQKEIDDLKKASMSADERAAAERKEREAAEKRTREEQEGKLKTKLADATKAKEAAEERWRSDRRNAALSSALHAAKVIGDAADDAASVMLGKSKIDVDDDGNVTGVIYAGKAYDTLADAAKQFLQDKQHYAQVVGNGGTGTRGPSGGGARGNKQPLFELSRETLLAMDREKRAGGRK